MAQTKTPTSAEVRAAGGALPVLVTSPDDDGKEPIFAKGMQGEIVVKGVVGVDGAFHDAGIQTSSRSSELDAFAQSLITRATYRPAKDKAGKPVAVRVAVPVHLWKDSLVDGSLFAKSCQDFVVDADWHAQAFPEERPNQLRSWLLISGATFAAELRSSRKPTTGPAFEAVYAACKANPSRKFVEVFSAEDRR